MSLADEYDARRRAEVARRKAEREELRGRILQLLGDGQWRYAMEVVDALYPPLPNARALDKRRATIERQKRYATVKEHLRRLELGGKVAGEWRPSPNGSAPGRRYFRLGITTH